MYQYEHMEEITGVETSYHRLTRDMIWNAVLPSSEPGM